MGIIKEIQEQPEHVRHIFMWVLVVITFSVVGFTWFRSTQKKFVALLNPEAAQESRALAEKEKANYTSPFATIGNSLKNLEANISELIGGGQMNLKSVINSMQNKEAVPPQELPVSGDK